MKGFEKSDCGVMIVHSEDDETIPIGYGYDKYYKKYKNNERFVFKKYTDRGHDVLVTEDGTLDYELFGEIVAFYDSYVQ